MEQERENREKQRELLWLTSTSLAGWQVSTTAVHHRALWVIVTKLLDPPISPYLEWFQWSFPDTSNKNEWAFKRSVHFKAAGTSFSYVRREVLRNHGAPILPDTNTNIGWFCQTWDYRQCQSLYTFFSVCPLTKVRWRLWYGLGN